MATRRIVVVGGGIAGAATCWSLAREHGVETILIERERQPGAHSTARNAAILRTAMRDPLLHTLARDSARFYRQPPAGFAPHRLLRRCGVLLCAPDEAAAELAVWAEDPACTENAVEWPLTRLREAWPLLAPGIARCWRSEEDGVADVHALLHGYLRGAREAGAELRTGVTAVDLLRERNGEVRGVRAIGPALPVPEAIEADGVVLAGGGWAAEPAAAAGLPLPLEARRRHLLVTTAIAEVKPEAPVAWIFGDEFYFRPESGGLLLSACDEVAVEAALGERTDPDIYALLERKTQRWLPSIADAPAAHLWAAMRTFAPDRRFVLGPDPRAEGLFWAAALGGHGISCGHEAGRLAAAWAAGATPPHEHAEAFLPARLLSGDSQPKSVALPHSARAQ